MRLLTGQHSPASCHSKIFSSSPSSPTPSNVRNQASQKCKLQLKMPVLCHLVFNNLVSNGKTKPLSTECQYAFPQINLKVSISVAFVPKHFHSGTFSKQLLVVCNFILQPDDRTGVQSTFYHTGRKLMRIQTPYIYQHDTSPLFVLSKISISFCRSSHGNTHVVVQYQFQ